MERATVWRGEEFVSQQEKGRRCKECGKLLSRYNKNDICNSHLFALRLNPNHGISKRVAFEDPLLRPRRQTKVSEKTYPPSREEVLPSIKTALEAVAAYYNTTPESLINKRDKAYSTDRRNIALFMAVLKSPHASRPHIADFFNLSDGSLKVFLAKTRRHLRTKPDIRADIEEIAKKIKISVA